MLTIVKLLGGCSQIIGEIYLPIPPHPGFRHPGLYPFAKNFFRSTFVQHVTVWSVRIWTYKNGDEKGHTCSRRSKNVKKRTKTDEKRILCKFTLNLFFRIRKIVEQGLGHRLITSSAVALISSMTASRPFIHQ